MGAARPWPSTTADRTGPSLASAAPAPAAAAPPWRHGLALLRALTHEFLQDRIPLVAAGITFYALLAIFPAISAFASIYGLTADLGDVREHLAQLRGVLPAGAIDVIGGELVRLTHTDHAALGLAFGGSLLVSLWSVSAGIKALIEGLNVAYETEERRGFIALSAQALGGAAGAIVLAMGGAYAMTLAGAWAPASPAASAVIGVLSWLGLIAAAAMLLTLLYRIAPSRAHVRGWRDGIGALAAALAWAAMSAGFSWYVATFGRYDKIYGSLGAAVGFLTWLWLSLIIVLTGAELNNQLQRRLPRTPVQ